MMRCYVDVQPLGLRKNPQTGTQTLDGEIEQVPSEVVGLFGGGGWTRTSDLRIMRPSL